MQLFVDSLTNVDFSYLHPERGLLGETWIASTQLDGALDQQGMVCDFGVVKKTLRNWLDDELDHRLAVPLQSPNLSLQEEGNEITLTWRYGSTDNPKILECTAPREAIALIDTDIITPESTSRWCIEQLSKLLPDTIAQLHLSFALETIDSAFYHYSHGLKKHNGNCQRIAHGHRSRLHIWRNDLPAPELELQWASTLSDIYIGTQTDIINESDDSYTFSYSTSQGFFSLKMPQSSCYLLETDSTVEWIASHIADQLKTQLPNDAIRVKAFEGLQKGAIASR